MKLIAPVKAPIVEVIRKGVDQEPAEATFRQVIDVLGKRAQFTGKAPELLFAQVIRSTTNSPGISFQARNDRHAADAAQDWPDGTPVSKRGHVVRTEAQK